MFKKLRAAWMQLAQILHRVTEPIFMFVMFFAVFTPYAVALRLFRRHRAFTQKTGSDTHWITHEKREWDFKRQF